jgi:hypothetical protein
MVEIGFRTNQVKMRRCQVNTGTRFFDNVLHRNSGKIPGSTHEYIVHIFTRRPPGFKTEPGGCIRLGIAINNQHLFSSLVTKSCNVQAAGCLTGTAFVMRKGNDSNFTT